jgi:peptidoglycan/LPS O-acetylase OafA/YrhL
LFCINSAIYLLPCFLIGYTLQVWSVPAFFEAAPRWRRGVLLALVAILVPAYVHLYGMIAAYPDLDEPKRSIFRLFLSTASCSFLFLLRPRLRFLAALGPFSYAIYLFHPFATSASRRTLELMRLDPSPPGLFATGLLLGVLVPVLLQMIAVGQRTTALLLLGIDAAPSPLALVPQRERR